MDAITLLYNAPLVDSRELLRLVYRFLGEVAPARAGVESASGARAPNVPDTFIPLNLRGVPKGTEEQGKGKDGE